jgi:hypothetical protein
VVTLTTGVWASDDVHYRSGETVPDDISPYLFDSYLKSGYIELAK